MLKTHQRRARREHNGQLQRQKRSRAVRQIAIFFGHSDPRPVVHSLLPGQDYKRPARSNVSSQRKGFVKKL